MPNLEDIVCLIEKSIGLYEQSRFIALVEDYSRNVELLNIAQNSSGASAAQFNTQLSGLQASMNRLQSAWEGLYTSVNGAPIFSGLIDTAANLLQMFGDLGLGATTLSTLLIFTIAKIAVAQAGASKAFILDEVAKAGATNVVTAALKIQGATLKANLTASLPAIASLGIVLVAVGALSVALYAINKVVNKNKIAMREATEAAQEYTGKMGAASQEITGLKSLQEEYKETYEKGEDLSAVRQKIIDQFPELAKTIDVESSGYAELSKAMDAYIVQKQKEVAVNAILAAQQKEIALQNEVEQNRKDVAARQKNILDSTPQSATENAFVNPENVNEVYFTSDFKNLSDEQVKKIRTTYTIEPAFVYNGKNYAAYQLIELVKTENATVTSQLEKAYKDSQTLSFSTVKSITPDILNNLQLSGDDAESVTSLMLFGMTPDDYDTNTGLLTKEVADKVNKEAIEKILTASSNLLKSDQASDELKESWKMALSGDFSGLSPQDIEQIKYKFGIDIENIFSGMKEEYDEKRKGLEEYFSKQGLIIPDSMSNNIATSWQNKLIDSANDPSFLEALKQAYKAISGEIDFSSFGADAKGIQDAINQLDPNNVSSMVDVISKLKKVSGGTATELYEALIPIIAKTGGVADSAASQINSFYSQIKVLKGGVEDGLQIADVLNTILDSEGKLTAQDFEADPLTGLWKIRKDSAEEMIGIYKQLILTKIDDHLATLDAAEAENKSELQTLENIRASVTDTKATVAQVRLKGALVNILAVLNNVLGINSSTQQNQANAILDSLDADESLADQLDDLIDKNKENAVNLETEKQLLELQKDSINNVTNAELLSGDAKDSNSKSTSEAEKASKAYVKALKAQAEALKTAAQAQEDNIKAEIEGIEKVLNKRKEALETENDNLQESIDNAKDEQEILLQGYLDYLSDRKDALNDNLEEMQKAAEKAQKIAQENNDALSLQNEVVQKYYSDQIALIQEKIDAISDETEAEDRLQKLQEAKDAYEAAKNNKNRLVLVSGAGWVFKRNSQEIADAQDALTAAEREVQTARLEKEKTLLQDQADAWAEKAENISKTTSELEKFAQIYSDFSSLTEEDRKTALQDFANAIVNNNLLNQDYTDKNKSYEDQSDEDVEGTIAWNLKQIDTLSTKANDLLTKIGSSADDLVKQSKIDQVVTSLGNLLGNQGIAGLTNQLEVLTNSVSSYTTNFLNVSNQIEQNKKTIEDIETALGDWSEKSDDLGKSQSELNKQLEIFNKYNQMTLDQLEKNGSVYEDIASKVSALADQWERANAAQSAYDAAQNIADSISSSGEGYATGGVNTYTGLAQVHGTKSRPEVILNNSQAGALFDYIEKLRTFSFNTNIPNEKTKETTIKKEDNSTNYTNCKFEVVTEEDSIEGLLKDVKSRSPLRKI